MTSGPDSGRRLITLELKSSNPTSQKRLRDEGPFRCWDRRDRPLESKRTQVAQNDISGKKQLKFNLIRVKFSLKSEIEPYWLEIVSVVE